MWIFSKAKHPKRGLKITIAKHHVRPVSTPFVQESKSRNKFVVQLGKCNHLYPFQIVVCGFARFPSQIRIYKLQLPVWINWIEFNFPTMKDLPTSRMTSSNAIIRLTCVELASKSTHFYQGCLANSTTYVRKSSCNRWILENATFGTPAPTQSSAKSSLVLSAIDDSQDCSQ